VGLLPTPDGLTVLCRFSSVEGEGYSELMPGARVLVDNETPGQDGCDTRVLTAARPVVQVPFW
jgi:cold shock CspA family protein